MGALVRKQEGVGRAFIYITHPPIHAVFLSRSQLFFADSLDNWKKTEYTDSVLETDALFAKHINPGSPILGSPVFLLFLKIFILLNI